MPLKLAKKGRTNWRGQSDREEVAQDHEDMRSRTTLIVAVKR